MEEEISSDYDILDKVESIYFTEDFCPSRRELEVGHSLLYQSQQQLISNVFIISFLFAETEWYSTDERD